MGPGGPSSTAEFLENSAVEVAERQGTPEIAVRKGREKREKQEIPGNPGNP